MEYQFKPWQPVVVRHHTDGIWKADFFRCYTRDLDFPFVCVGGIYRQCLPAKGYRHLLDTTDNPTPPEPEFKFGDLVEVRDNTLETWHLARFLRKGSDHACYPYQVFRGDVDRAEWFRYCRHVKQEG